MKPLATAIVLTGLCAYSAHAGLDSSLYTSKTADLADGAAVTADYTSASVGVSAPGGAVPNNFGIPVVPEPSTYLIGGLLLLPLGVASARKLRHSNA